MQPSRPWGVRMEECRDCRDIVHHHAGDSKFSRSGDLDKMETLMTFCRICIALAK